MKKLVLIFVCVFLLLPVFSQTYIFTEPPIYHDSLRQAIINNPPENIYPVRLSPCSIKTTTDVCVNNMEIFSPSSPPCNLPEITCNTHCEDTAGYVVYGLCVHKGLLFGNYVVFYPSGHPLAWYIMENGEISGSVFHYYDIPGHPPSKTQSAEKGQLLSELEYNSGKLRNVKKLFSLDGKKQDKGSFKNGNGVLHVYRPSGTLLRTLTFSDGVPYGTCTYYYSNGMKMMEGMIEDNLLEGAWREYDMQGNVVQQTMYNNGVMISTHKIQ